MEIREIKKLKPLKPIQETNLDSTANPPTVNAKPTSLTSSVNEDKKPRRLSEEEKQQRSNEDNKDYKQDKFQHIKIIDCNQPVSRVICECWHCLQGLLIQVEALPPQYLEAECPTCGKCAIRLQGNQVISTTPIPSPWG